MSIRIDFDNPKLEYYPGTTISGTVHVQLSEPKNIKRIAIKFKGEANTRWTERRSRRHNGKTEHHTVYYTGNQKLFDYGINFVEGPGKFQLQPGYYSYRFEYLLRENLPVNWEGTYGSLRYTVKAFIDIPWSFDISCKQEFRIIPVVNLNLIQLARQRFLIETQKTVGVLCCASGKISLTVTAPRCGFICSEIIPLYVQIENNSGSDVYETDIKLTKNVTCQSTSPSHAFRTESTTLVSGKWATEVKRGGQHILQAPLQLVLTEPSTIDETLLIKIGYKVEVTCKIAGMHTNLRGTFPIIIGNVPMNDSGNYTQPPVMSPTTPIDIGWNQQIKN